MSAAPATRYSNRVDTWDLLQSPPADAASNMATDEALLRTAADRGRPLLRIYSWTRPAISIGYFQKFPADLADRYDIVRRPTGGGLVYHGADTTFTLVAPPAHPLYRLRAADAYCAIHTAVAGVFERPTQLARRTLPVAGNRYECFQNPVAGDLVAGQEKLAGGAQRRNRDGLLHQGSIAAAVAGQLARAFSRHFDCRFVAYELTGEQHALIAWLADGKYRTVRWNHRR